MNEEKDFERNLIKLFYKQGKELALTMQSQGILELNEDLEAFAK